MFTVTGALAPPARLDLKDNALILDYDPPSSPIGPWDGNTYGGVTALVANGRNGGDWSGNGIVTSSAGANDYTSLGVVEASDALGISGSDTATFAGESIDASSVLVKFTYGGDANLDGVVNIDDYSQLDGSTATGGALRGWFNGDFNYDGDVNIDDYSIIDGNLPVQGSPM
jgi:hypothetical protein